MSEHPEVKCPKCGDVIELEFFDEVGDVISCYHCDTELKITGMHPPKVVVLKQPDFEPEDEADDYPKEFDEDRGFEYEDEDEDY